MYVFICLKFNKKEIIIIKKCSGHNKIWEAQKKLEALPPRSLDLQPI